MLIFITSACFYPPFLMDLDVTESPAESEGSDQVEGDIPAGYAVFSANGVEVTLPSYYILGDIGSAMQSLSGTDAAFFLQIAQDNQLEPVLWAYSAETYLVVLKNDIYAGMPLAVVGPVVSAMMGNAVESLVQDRISLGEREAVRYQTTTQGAETESAQVTYIFNDSDQLWVLAFLSSASQIEGSLAAFDAATASFTVVE